MRREIRCKTTSPPRSTIPTNKAVRSKKAQTGQSLIETAITLPVLIFLFMAFLQLLAWGWTSILCTHAAYAAARVYTVRHADDESAALGLAQDTAQRILNKAWPPAWVRIDAQDALQGECHLHLTAYVPPLWGWRWALANISLFSMERDARIEDEATDARVQEDAFAKPKS